MIAGKSHSLARWGDVPDETIDLAEAALHLAALESPGCGLDPYRTHLAEIAGQVAERAAAGSLIDIANRVAALTEVVVGIHGYRGDGTGYDDLDNANLIRVIDRRKGLPVAIGIIYIQAARAQGWLMTGLDFPGHFLVRLETESGMRAILDPFDDGEIVTARRMRRLLKESLGPMAELSPGNYQPMGNRDILLRLQNNVKVRRLRAGRLDGALEAVEAMLAFAPAAPELWREAGLIHTRLGNLGAAVAAFERFITLAPESPARRRTAELLRELYGRIQ